MGKYFGALVLLGSFSFIYGQGVTGQLSGTVVDPSSAVLTGAKVRLTVDDSKQERNFTTAGNGAFFFTGLIPGNYTLNVSLPGFKTYSQ